MPRQGWHSIFQERDLRAAGAERIFAEQVSSTAHRAKLNECLAFVREGDVLAVSKPDRLARSTAELPTIERDLSDRGTGLLILSMGGRPLDRRNPTARLMLAVLGAVAEWERQIMLERQKEGIARAADAGRYKGRKPTARAKSQQVLVLAKEGNTRSQIAAQLGIGVASVYRILRSA